MPFFIAPKDILLSFGKAPSAPLHGKLRILLWNLNKCKTYGSARHLSALCRSSDLALLQEAILSSPAESAMTSACHMGYTMAQGYLSPARRLPTGVITGYRSEPEKVFYTCSPHREPIIRTPKMALGTLHNLEHSSHKLLVINVHAVNFMRTAKYECHIRAIEEMARGHRGPLLFAGDFNTWNAEREYVLSQCAKRLSLEEVTFAMEGRTKYLGKIVDRLFLRGLKPLRARADTHIKSSDHVPIWVEAEIS